MAAYEAREEVPYALDLPGGLTVHTARLTSGGISMLQALATLSKLGWESGGGDRVRRGAERAEALRQAWVSAAI